MVCTLCFFSLKFSLFHNSNLFGPCIIHILQVYTECAKIKKNNSGAKRLKDTHIVIYSIQEWRSIKYNGEICSCLWTNKNKNICCVEETFVVFYCDIRKKQE